MGEWKKTALGEVLDFGNGKSRPMEEGSVPVYGGNGILGYTNRSNYSDKTIAIGRVGAYCGAVYFEDGPVWISDNALAAKAKAGNDALFFYYLLKNADLNQHAGGSSHPLVTQTLLNSLEFSICRDEEEQRAIASVLSSLDAKIDLLHRQNKTLEAMAEALFRQWFVEEAEDSWPWEQLGNHVEVLRGLSYTGAGLCEKGEGVPMHNLNSIRNGGGYKYEGIKYYAGEYKERHVVRGGDVIVANTDLTQNLLLIGCPAIVPMQIGTESVYSHHLYKLNILSPALSNLFVYHLLLSADVRDQITGATNGSTVNMLPKDGIEMATFQMPPKDKIERFNAIIAPMHQKQEKNYIQVQTLTAQRDTLLPKLMSGEVRVEVQ